jgi:methionyl-tRNA synthetase
VVFIPAKKKYRYLVTSALPYVNYELHLGHLVGCLLPADIYSRFLRLSDEECVYVCGTDEYGTPSAVEAEKQGMTPKQLCDKYAAIQKDSLQKMGLKFDIFSRTTAPEHTKVVQDFYHLLKQNNFIYKKELEQLYCEHCKRFLPDRYVEGVCPYCGYESARGDQCERCGKLLEPMQLKKPYCITCKKAPVTRKTEHIFFELPKVEEQLQKWIEKNKHWPINARNFSLGWIKDGLEDRCISRDMSWGVPIPDLPGKVFYVWFDAPLGYVTFSKQIGKEGWWKDKNTRIVHFLGKDNIAFHTIFFPGMLMAAGGYMLPYQIASNEFLNYEGKKFSKSKRIGVHIREALDMYPADYWRYMLASTMPQHRDSDFTWEEFAEKVNNDLNDALGNFVHRTLTLDKTMFEGKVPEPGKLKPEDKRLLKKIPATAKHVSRLMYDIKLKEALIDIMALAREGNAYLTENEPWKNKDRQAPTIYVCMNIVRGLSIMLDPFIPESSLKMRRFLGMEGGFSWKDVGQELTPGQKIGAFEPLFKKLEAAEIREHKQRFSGTGVAEKGAVSKAAGGKPMVSYDEFAKLEIKVGVVKKAEKVAGTDRLIKLEVDTGEPRTLVAGVGDTYSPDQMVGKKIIVLTNLQPRAIKGIESQGMLLAVSEGEKAVSLLTVDRDAKPGLRIE